MEDGLCPRCGGPNPRSGRICQWCGTRFGPYDPFADFRSDPNPKAIRETAEVVVVIFLVVGAALATALVVLPRLDNGPAAPVPTVDVTRVLGHSSSNVCGLDNTSAPGFFAAANGTVQLNWFVPASANGVGLPCTISGLTTSTPGFGVVAALPVTVARPLYFLALSVHVPPRYTGPLNLTFG